MAARRIKLAHPGKILREEFMEPIGLSAYAMASLTFPGTWNVTLRKRHTR